MSADWIDGAGAVRKGEELDLERLEVFLSDRLSGYRGGLEVRQFRAGYSNLTYLLCADFEEGPRQLVLRRPPFGSSVKTAHDMGREFRILSGLSPVWPKVPQPLAFCETTDVLGAPFYVMEKLEGVILRGRLPEGLEPEPALMAGVAGAFVESLAELHAIVPEAAGLADLGLPDGYVRRQVDGWGDRWLKARTDDVPDMDFVAAWLESHQPGETGVALIHNDFKYDNIVLSADDWTHVIGVLDWEMATLGDPLMDLGTTLGYWLEPGDPPEVRALALSPTLLPGNPDRTRLVELYATASGRSVGHLDFYFAYGLFKIAVIIQQIYYRYRKGMTADPRFGGLGTGVIAYAALARRVVELRRIDRLFGGP